MSSNRSCTELVLEHKFVWSESETVKEPKPDHLASVSEGICPCLVAFHSHPFVQHNPPAPCLTPLASVSDHDGQWGYCEQCTCYWRVRSAA